MRRRLTAVVLAAVLAAAGCSGGHHSKEAGEVRAVQTLGPGEGSLALLAMSGDTEDGGDDSQVDWVTPFEKKTDCRVDVKYAADPQNMLDLMERQNLHYDGVAAPPEIAGKLIADRQVVPVNTGLVGGYKELEPRLRSQLTVRGRHYAIPFTWGSNLLMYDQRMHPQTDTWASIFDAAQARKYAGHIIVRDSQLTLGDAALYLKARDHKLHIKDPFKLTSKQLAAASELISRQRPYVQEYWRASSDAVGAFAGSGAVIGQAWPYQVDVLSRSGRPVAGVMPREGVTGWADSWMIGARADHPSCMYQWLSWISSPDVQQQVAEWNGVAPANPGACGHDRLSQRFCGAYHVGDRSYIDKVVFAKTPTENCAADDKSCTDYDTWNRTWHTARG